MGDPKPNKPEFLLTSNDIWQKMIYMEDNVSKVSIIGSGTMGTRIGLQTASHDYFTRLQDIDSQALKNAKEKIINEVEKEKGKKAAKRISCYTDIDEAVNGTDLVIETVPEKLELKKNVFSRIDEKAPSHAIIATNSSSIPVSKLEGAVERKEKVLNIHFYLPWPMADIMRGSKTSDNTFEKGKHWIESLECEPLEVKKECYGFVFNRIWHAVKKDCLKIWAGSYASVEDVDKAWKIFTEMDKGPFALMDHVGLDVVYDIEMSYYKESGDPEDKPPEELKKKIDIGELGKKSGEGFYKWEDGKPVEVIE